MTYKDTMSEINGRRAEMMATMKKMQALQAGIEPEVVDDYSFSTQSGEVKLSQLFGEKNTLFVIHNMGTSCPSCTQWADGFNGLLPHLADRAAFVVSSPDQPEVQAKFAAGRGWKFTMISHEGTDFASKMGYGEDGRWFPGVSVFKQTDEGVVRVSDAEFGTGDLFNPVWSFLDMIPEGPDGWDAKFIYG